MKLIELKLSIQMSSLQFGNFRFGNRLFEKYWKEVWLSGVCMLRLPRRRVVVCSSCEAAGIACAVLGWGLCPCQGGE